jgi:hypothetical protein
VVLVTLWFFLWRLGYSDGRPIEPYEDWRLSVDSEDWRFSADNICICQESFEDMDEMLFMDESRSSKL